jgi:hypothetical protein
MVRYRGRLFKCAAVLEVGGGLGCPETVVAELSFDAGAAARRRIIAYAFACGIRVRVSKPVPRPIVRNSGRFGSVRRPASIHVATCTGSTAAIDDRPTLALGIPPRPGGPDNKLLAG